MKKNILSAVLVAALSLGNMSAAYASDAGAGIIQDIWAMPNGTILFNHAGARTGPPGCQNGNTPKRWAIDGSTPAGQATLAALLTAYSLGKPIFIYGTGACPNWPDTETVSWFAIASEANGNGAIL